MEDYNSPICLWMITVLSGKSCLVMVSGAWTIGEAVAYSVFIDPPLAHVGLNETQARKMEKI